MKFVTGRPSPEYTLQTWRPPAVRKPLGVRLKKRFYQAVVAAAFIAGVQMSDKPVVRQIRDFVRENGPKVVKMLTGTYNSATGARARFATEPDDKLPPLYSPEALEAYRNQGRRAAAPPASARQIPHAAPDFAAGLLGRPEVAASLHSAAANNPVPYGLLARMADVESNFNPMAVNPRSGACGLMQIMPESTMLELLYRHGEKHGYKDYADSIEPVLRKTKGGRVYTDWTITNPAMRDKILSACLDPQLSSHMATEYLRENLTRLEQELDRPLNYTDAYLTHFLGQEGSVRFLLAYDNPGLRHHRAADYVSRPAAAQNRTIFYDNGRARSLDEVYELFAAKMGKDALPPMQPWQPVSAAAPAQPKPQEKSIFSFWR